MASTPRKIKHHSIYIICLPLRPFFLHPSKQYFYALVLLFALIFDTGESFNNCAILDDYKMHEKIGEGGFGSVHLATNRETNVQYAIKFMDMTQTRK